MTLLTTVSVNVVFLTHSVVTPSLVGAAGNFEINSLTSGVDVALWSVVTSLPPFVATSFPVARIPETPGSRPRLPLFFEAETETGAVVVSFVLDVLPVEVLSVY